MKYRLIYIMIELTPSRQNGHSMVKCALALLVHITFHRQNTYIWNALTHTVNDIHTLLKMSNLIRSKA